MDDNQLQSLRLQVPGMRALGVIILTTIPCES